MSDLVRVVPHDDGAVWQVTFGAGSGNILDRATMRELARVFVDARAASHLKAICLEGAGRDFSFGASVQEHQLDQVRSMLETLRASGTHRTCAGGRAVPVRPDGDRVRGARDRSGG